MFDCTITNDHPRSKWAEIRNDELFVSEDETEKIIFIDAWETDDPSEVGKVIAEVRCKLQKNGGYIIETLYNDARATFDPYAQEMIREAESILRGWATT